MIKLYLKEDGRITRYHEAWTEDDEIVEHWGRLGTQGRTRTLRRTPGRSDAAELKRVLQGARELGYKAIRADHHRLLTIEYAIKGMGSASDLRKRHALEDRLNDLLGWAGLGHCDGGSIGSGTMEVCCSVVDFAIARKVIVRNLRGTRFANYARIYDEAAD